MFNLPQDKIYIILIGIVVILVVLYFVNIYLKNIVKDEVYKIHKQQKKRNMIKKLQKKIDQDKQNVIPQEIHHQKEEDEHIDEQSYLDPVGINNIEYQSYDESGNNNILLRDMMDGTQNRY